MLTRNCLQLNLEELLGNSLIGLGYKDASEAFLQRPFVRMYPGMEFRNLLNLYRVYQNKERIGEVELVLHSVKNV